MISPRIDARVRRLRSFSARHLGDIAERLTPPPTSRQLRARVGGRWDEIGTLQFEYLVAQGMKPEHTMLDVGCGVLRGGLHSIRYLDAGNYYGIDIAPEMIEGARRELAGAGLEAKQPTLRVTDSFDMSFGRPIDYALALSVFTHIPWNSMYRALSSMAVELRPGGQFFATFFRGPEGPERFEPITQPALDGYVPVTTFADANPYHYAPSDFEGLCAHLPLRVDDLGDWQHPRGQQMLRFTRV